MQTIAKQKRGLISLDLANFQKINYQLSTKVFAAHEYFISLLESRTSSLLVR